MWFRSVTLALIAACAAAGCGRKNPGALQIKCAADLRGCHVAHLSSDFHRDALKALQPEIVFDPYTEYSFAIESLRKRKLDAISLGRSYAELWLSRYPGEFCIAFDYAEDHCSFLLKKGSPLKPRLDAAIAEMRDSGELAELISRWKKGIMDGAPPPLPKLEPPADAQEVRVASAAQCEPWCYITEAGVSGIDQAILHVLANRLGLRLRQKDYNWGGMIDAANGGKADLANGCIYTGGNLFSTLDVSEHYNVEKMCILVRNEGFRGAAGGLAHAIESLRGSFVRTFVTENRWRLMLYGLGVTLFITLMSVILGTVLAFPVWLARISKVRVVSSIGKTYVSALQGTPILVLLMVLFYIVFGNVDIAGIWVAIIGFGLNASAYFGEIIRSGVAAVPNGQMEAALALGYGRYRAFFRFVLPQAARIALPVYRGDVIGILKSTSIVGYIAIGDLTKASDLIRSRTYESFFPILTTALVYFLVAWLMAMAIDALGRRLDPAFRRDRGDVAGKRGATR